MRDLTIPTIVLSLSAFALKAQDPPTAGERTQAPVGTATLVTEPPLIDGRLHDVAWNDAEILSGFVQVEPVEGDPVSERTEIRLVYDESALYVGAWMFVDDPSTDIRHFGVFDRTGFDRGPKGRQFIIKYTKQFDIGR